VKAYIIKRGSQTVGVVLDDPLLAEATKKRLRIEDFDRHRIQFRDLDQYDLTHRWWVEEAQVL
jgi:uncharacterized protein (DUF427 family)